MYVLSVIVEQLEEQVRRLPPQELADFVLWLDTYLGRTPPGDDEPEAESEGLSEQEQAELLRRRAEILANSSLSQPMDDEYFERLKRELSGARAQRASGH